MLEVKALNAFYGPVQVLHGVSLSCRPARSSALVGANAAGKSTLMFTLAGPAHHPHRRDPARRPVAVGLPAYERVVRGLVLVPERRRLFPFMTVLENLEIGAYSAAARAVARAKPGGGACAAAGAGRAAQSRLPARSSGGEQQMLAIGRALMAKPRVLLLDEPTEGLAPIYVKLLFDLIRNLRSSGLTVLIVEQNVHHVLRTADRAYVLENGRLVLEGRGEDLLNDERLKVAYLGL